MPGTTFGGRVFRTAPHNDRDDCQAEDIDRGRGGDKVDVIDPAAAPLGTDEEAAGTPVSREAVKQAHAYEIGSAPVSSERRDGDHAVAMYLGVVGVVALTLGTAIWLNQVG